MYSKSRTVPSQHPTARRFLAAATAASTVWEPTDALLLVPVVPLLVLVPVGEVERGGAESPVGVGQRWASVGSAGAQVMALTPPLLSPAV